MRYSFSKTITSVLLVLSMLVNMSPMICLAETTDTGSEVENGIVIPKASNVEHVHNSVGWVCHDGCIIPEHTHTIEDCYVESGEPVCDYHDHTADCYADGVLVCGKHAATAHTHTIENCYKLTCIQVEGEDHTHTIEDCYELTCTQEESEGHEHSESCYLVFSCDQKEHTHDNETCEKRYDCETEYVLLTVEYYITVNGQEVRAASTFQVLLNKADEYSAPIPDLRPDGYKIDTITRYTAGNEDNPETLAATEADGKYTVSGTMEKDTKIIVNYVYENEYAPYRIDYWGYNAAGQDQVLLYSYIGMGKKDSQLSVSQDDVNTDTISIGINDLMKNLYDVLGEKDQLGSESGQDFLKNLTNAVNALYLTGDEPDQGMLYHDITPLLETVAGVDKSDDAAARVEKLNKLTRTQLKQYIAEKIVKVYGFDKDSQQVWDAKLTVTADELAVRNLYYVPKKPQTVLFMTGLPNAEVIGIPQTPIESTPDEDGVDLKYDIKLNKNYITTLPTVDISGYTKNVYAKHQSYVFVGWVTGEDAQVITDYTPTNAAGKYKDIVIYTADGDPADTNKPNIPGGVTMKPLADEIQKMPDGGVTYYGVWQPYAAPYTVQLWFESEQGDNTYVESHTHDIQRYAGIGMPITFNEFDVDRAKEQQVIDAANNSSNVIFDDSIRFEDPDSDTIDVYNSYTDYKNSPFYGFDFLECAVCEANPDNCGTGGCTCGKQRTTNADGSEGTATSVTACNYQRLTVGEDGTTVLNLYYTREMWEIAINPDVQLWTVQAFVRPTEFNPHTYWTGGEEQNNIKDALEANKDNYKVITGKYGTQVAAEYQSGIGWDKLGSYWQNEIGAANQNRTIPAGTEILVANGSAAFFDAADADGDGYPDNDGFYVYPQDTLTYISSTAGTVPPPADWTLPFHGLSTIEPEMFTNRTGRHVDRDDLSSPYITIQNRVSMWDNQRFGEESTYNLADETTTYGSHRLNVYPYYHSVSDNPDGLAEHEFRVNYYLQALPHEKATAPYAYTTKNNDEIKFVKDVKDGEDSTVSITSPASLLFYSADTPDGFVPLMWRTSPLGLDGVGTGAYNRNGFQGKGVLVAAQRYTFMQIVSTGMNQYQVPPASVSIDYLHTKYGYHNASFNQYNYKTLNGNSVYMSDWRQLYTNGRPTQDSASLASVDPGRYWVADWIRAGETKVTTSTWNKSARLDGSLTGENGLYALITKANQGDAEATALLNQLEDSFSAGAFYPTGATESIYYHRSNAEAYRYSSNGQFSTEQELTNSENAVAFARKQYSITYNTCFLNEDGEVLRDENGIVMVPLHTTQYETDDDGVIIGNEDMIDYAQPLGYDPDKTPEIADFDDFYNNYYDAYFTYNGIGDPTKPGSFAFAGYGNKTSVDKSDLGGYGRWYLDPDGTIPFNEENMLKMPAGNVDVYYRYNDFRYNIYFVDEEVTGKDKDPVDVVINGEEKTLNGVINHQSIVPNTTAETFDNPSDPSLYFAGWFYDEAGTHPYDFNMEINEDTVVYAVWKPKVPTEYQIRHVLVDANGNEIRDIVEPKWEESYVGNTIDANALGSEYYADGMYFKVDDYSQSMVLEAQNAEKTKNILTFYYTYAGLRYTIEYKDIHSKIDILPSQAYATKLSIVTLGMTEIPGWEYQGYSVDDGALVEQKRHVTTNVTADGIVVTFWYERIPADDEIVALKTIDGVLSEGTWFHFELLDEDGNVVRTAQSVDGIIRFDSLELDTVGTYRYTMREVNESDKYQINYDSTVYEVVVEITQPDIAQPLVCSVTYYKDGKELDSEDQVPIFENHRIPQEVQFTAEKYLDDKLLEGEGFVFLLQGGEGLLTCGHHIHDDSCYNLQPTCGMEEDADHTHTDDCYEKVLICGEDESADHTAHDQSCYSARTTLIEKQSAANGTISFSSISFTKPGIYVYTIHERNEGHYAYEYDEKQYRVAVEVFINDHNELDKKVTVTCDGEPAENIRFDNYTKPDPELQLTAEKYLDDKLMAGNGFVFVLEGGEGLLECGYHVHEYSCYELQPTCGNEENADHAHTDDCYEEVLICKEQEDADHTAHDQSCYSAQTTLIEEQNASNGKVVFSPLTYTQPGMYIYTVYERNEGHYVYEYDGTQYRVAVKVFINDRNELERKVTILRDGEEVESIRFDNYTKPIPEVQLTAEKYLDGELMAGDGFVFVLEGGEGLLNCDKNHTHDQSCYNAPAALVEKQSASNGSIVFSPLAFMDPGFYIYNVYERNEGNYVYKYDDALYRVAIEVFINENKDLEPKITITRNGEEVENIRFDNYTKPDPEVQLTAEKYLDGKLLEGEGFVFVLEGGEGVLRCDKGHTAHDQSCYSAPATLIEEQNALNGNIVFGTQTFTHPGFYIYNVYERDEGNYVYKYDNALYRVAIEVFVNANNDLDKKITIMRNGDPVENIRFDNYTKPDPEVQLTAEKYLDGELLEGEGFVFVLEGGEGLLDCGYHVHDDSCYELQPTCGMEEDADHTHTDDCYEEALICGEEESADHTEHNQSCYIARDVLIEEQNASDGNITFSSLSFKQPGIYIYNVYERNEGNYVYKYDNALYRVEIEVFVNANNDLDTKVTVTCDGEEVENIRFDNYTNPNPEVQLTAEKYLDGKLMSGDGFLFLLEGGEGLLDCGYHVHDDSCYELQPACGMEEDADHTHTDDCYEEVLICGEKESADHTEHNQTCYNVNITLSEEQNASNGNIVFNPLIFTHPGTYFYRVYERNEGNASYQYDDTLYCVAIEVFINEDNMLDKKVTITCEGDPVENIRFDNYTNPIPTDPDNPTDLGNPGTGDGFKLYLWLLLIGISGIAATLKVSRRRYKVKQKR